VYLRSTSDIAAIGFRGHPGYDVTFYRRSNEFSLHWFKAHISTRLEPHGVVGSTASGDGPFAVACLSTAPAIMAVCTAEF
jgi:acyl-CoA reductase-like NAD-dependent aldehyde dehydrogenase